MDALTITKDKNQGFECATERFQEYHDKGGHSYCHSMRRTHKESRLVNNIMLSENKAFGYMKGHSGLGRTVMEVMKGRRPRHENELGSGTGKKLELFFEGL